MNKLTSLAASLALAVSVTALATSPAPVSAQQTATALQPGFQFQEMTASDPVIDGRRTKRFEFTAEAMAGLQMVVTPPEGVKAHIAVERLDESGKWAAVAGDVRSSIWFGTVTDGAGKYRLVIGFEGGRTGRFALNPVIIRPSENVIPLQTVQVGEISPASLLDGQMRVQKYSTTVSGGKRIRFTASSKGFPIMLAGRMADGGEMFLSNRNSEKATLELTAPKDGKFTLMVVSQNGASGNYALFASAATTPVSPPPPAARPATTPLARPAAPPLRPPAPAPAAAQQRKKNKFRISEGPRRTASGGMVRVGDLLSGRFEPGDQLREGRQADIYTVKLKAGEEFVGRIITDKSGPWIRASGPGLTGTPHPLRMSIGSSELAVIHFIARESGTYTLEALAGAGENQNYLIDTEHP